jgi:hypothetical protein
MKPTKQGKAIEPADQASNREHAAPDFPYLSAETRSYLSSTDSLTSEIWGNTNDN